MPIFILSAIIQFFLAGIMIINSGHNAATLVNNSGYMFMSLIPLLFFIKNIKLKWLYLIIIYAFCLLSMKRGAMLIGTLGVGYVVYKEISLASRKIKIRLFYSVSILIIIIGIGFAKLYNDNEFFRYRIEATMEGNTSRRDVIYEEIYAYFLNKETIVEQLIGKGADATLTIGENYAHNDWLEILIDNGLLGILIFISYWIGFYRQVKRFKKSHYRAAFFLIFVMGLLKTFFSMYYTSIATPMAFATGLCLCQLNIKRNNESNIPSKPCKALRSHQPGIEYS